MAKGAVNPLRLIVQLVQRDDGRRRSILVGLALRRCLGLVVGRRQRRLLKRLLRRLLRRALGGLNSVVGIVSRSRGMGRVFGLGGNHVLVRLLL